MALQTHLLDFLVDTELIQNETQITLLLTKIENILKCYVGTLKPVTTISIDGGCYKIYSGDRSMMVTLRIVSDGMITINIEYVKQESEDYLLTLKKYGEMASSLRACGVMNDTRFPPIHRGTFSRYYITTDDRLMEYDVDNVLFQEQSPYQKVQIVHSKSFGNMLVLDDLLNISESDYIYTDTLIQRGKESYRDKEIVILGGGDGGLLYELLKENPKNVVMLEIDEVVMRACSKHMRSICGDVLDKKSGPNYEIIVGDCMKSLDQFVRENRTFDYVFGDLTDLPIADQTEVWDFIKKYVSLSFKILKPTGKYLTQGNGACSIEALQYYESYLETIEPKLVVNKCQVFVPSYYESWVFYQIHFANQG